MKVTNEYFCIQYHNMCSYFNWILTLLLWIQTVKSMSLMTPIQHSYFLDNSGPDNDVADFIVSKGYLPSEKDLPKTSVVKNVENDVTYLLSKLSDEELIKLLNDQPKKAVYDINDIVRAAVDTKTLPDNSMLSSHNTVPILEREQDNSKFTFNLEQNKPLASYKNNRFRTVADRNNGQDAYFRLDDKRVDGFSLKSDADPNYAALQKLNNMLYSRPQEELEKSEEDDERKELLFDVLVAQLKTLCCKKSKSSKVRSDSKKNTIKAALSDLLPQESFYPKSYSSDLKPSQRVDINGNEYMFLIINDEIKGNGSEELISVDPESLEKNSSVLLLGPITTPLTNSQLKSVMTRISNELSKPDYIPLLQQIADGTLSGSNIKLMKSLITGPETRRYIKPHRCNHQSRLAKIYGGPKWLICTGYLNLNTPSLYD